MPGKKPNKVAADRRNRDAEVLEAAIKVFYEKGYAASSIQDVADIVGMLKGSLYHYISSKEDLLFRIMQQSHEHARAIMLEISELDVGPSERLYRFLHRMYLWYLSHVERVSVYFNQRQYLTGTNHAIMRKNAREFARFIRDLLSEAKQVGELRGDLDVKLASFFIVGALNSIPTWYRRSGEHPPEYIADEFARMSLAALVASGLPEEGGKK